MRLGVKLLLVAVAVVAAGVMIGFYVSNLTTLAGSPSYAAPVSGSGGHPVVNLQIQTVAAVGPKLSRNPDWVSYLIKDNGRWQRKTVWTLPAHATVHVTIYNFDGASALRNPFFARPQGMVGNHILVDGKSVDHIDPNDASTRSRYPSSGSSSRSRASRTTPRTRAATRRAHSRWRTTRSPSRSARASRGATAGSASSRARPPSSSVTVVQCSRPAGWTATCRWCEWWRARPCHPE